MPLASDTGLTDGMIYGAIGLLILACLIGMVLTVIVARAANQHRARRLVDRRLRQYQRGELPPVIVQDYPNQVELEADANQLAALGYQMQGGPVWDGVRWVATYQAVMAAPEYAPH